MKNDELQEGYQIRINRVFEFIDANLEADLSLHTISEVAFFSPFHFHRVFKFVTGETLNEYITRQRIEKSAGDLLHTNMKAAEIAHKYGFGDGSSYSKTFKKYYGEGPAEFKKQNVFRHSKIRQLHRKNGQVYPDRERYICIIKNLKSWMKMNAKIEIRELPQMELAYVTCVGSKNLSAAYDKLMKWAISRSLVTDEAKLMTVYHDSFKFTEPEKVRMSASILINEAVEIDREIQRRKLGAGKFIVGRFEIGVEEFEKSWTGLFVWMNENGFVKANREPFEIYHNNFNEHSEGIVIVDFCIPIE